MTPQLLIIGLALVGLAVAAGRKPTLLYPVANPKITSPYGTRKHPVTGKVAFHNGIDLAAATGTAVASPADGVVSKIGYTTDGGNEMLIEHTNGYRSGFAHLSSYAVAVGDTVKQSQLVARSGATGQVTGPHLHYTLRNPAGQLVDPAAYLV